LRKGVEAKEKVSLTGIEKVKKKQTRGNVALRRTAPTILTGVAKITPRNPDPTSVNGRAL